MPRITFSLTLLIILFLTAACSGQSQPTVTFTQTGITTGPVSPATPTQQGTATSTPFINEKGIPTECLRQDAGVPKGIYDMLGYGDLGCAHISSSPDGKLLAFSKAFQSPNGRTIENVEILDLKSGEGHIVYTTPTMYLIRKWAWGEDGRLHITVSDIEGNNYHPIFDPSSDSVVEATPAPTPAPPLLMTMQSGFAVDQLAWSPDGKNLVAAGCPDGKCSLQWIDARDLSTRIWQVNAAGVISVLDIDPAGKTIAALVKQGIQSRDESGRILEADKTEIWLFRTSDGAVLRHWDAGQARSLRFNPDGSRIGTAGGPAVLWDVNSGGIVWQLLPGQMAQSASQIRLASLDRSALYGGGCGMEGDPDEKYDLVAFNPTQPIIYLSVNHDPCGSLVAWDLQAKRLAASVDWNYQTTDISNPATDTYKYANLALGFDADANTLLLATKGLLRTWDLRTGELTEKAGLDSYIDTAPGTAFSPDGKKAVLWGTSYSYQENWPLVSYDVTAWQFTDLTTSTYPGDQVLSAAFSRDGLRLASVDKNGILKLWDVAGGSH
ncbi:MAG TPA: WD40 repeat domain-containing protein [Anaerolineales bacterium]|nr:WD40 repeat domain-containing protein [Anaerolineales bacterium]